MDGHWHYKGKKPLNIDEYLQTCDEDDARRKSSWLDDGWSYGLSCEIIMLKKESSHKNSSQH